MTGEYKTELRSKGSAHKVTIEDIYEEPEDYNNNPMPEGGWTDEDPILIDTEAPNPQGNSNTGPRENRERRWRFYGGASRSSDDVDELSHEEVSYDAAEAQSEDETLSDDPLDDMTVDDAVWAYQRKPHGHLPVWEPRSQRPWAEPLLHLLSGGLPVLHNVVQGRPPLGPLPEPKQTALSVDDPGRRGYAFMNDAHNRELLIDGMNRALDEVEQSPEIREGGYPGVLNRGRALSKQLEATFPDELSERLAQEVSDYLLLHSHSAKQDREAGSGSLRETSAVQADAFTRVHATSAHQGPEAVPTAVTSGGKAQSPLLSVTVAAATAATAVGVPLLPETATAVAAATNGWKRKGPLAAVIVGLPTLAYGLYRWYNAEGPAEATEATAKTTFVPGSDFQELIDELEAPNLDFLFYGEPIVIEAPSEEALKSSEKGSNNRNKRSIGERLSDPDDRSKAMSTSTAAAPSVIKSQLIELAGRGGVGLFLTRVLVIVDESHEVVRAASQSIDERNAIYILKYIELLESYYNRYFKSEYEPIRSTCSELLLVLDKLWGIANGLSDPFAQAKVAEYKQVFPTRPSEVTSTLTETASTSTEPPSTTAPAIALTDAIKTHGEKALNDIAELYDPILNPVGYVDDYIDKTISDFNKERGTKFSRNPDNKITIKVTQLTNDEDWRGGGDGKSFFRLIEAKQYSYREIATGQFRVSLNSIAPWNAVEKYSNDNEKDLVAQLWCSDVQSRMLQALDAYCNNSQMKKNMKAHYESQARLRSLEYLDSPNRLPGFEDAVLNFLAGETKGKEVSFNGVTLNGVFLVPYGSSGGVLFSVDEPGFFHVHTSNPISYRTPYGRSIRTAFSMFDQSAEFRKWVLNKMPSAEAEKHKGAPFTSTIKRDRGGLALPSGQQLTRPFTFTESSSFDDLTTRLFSKLIERLRLDINGMVYSRREAYNDAWLGVAKTILTLGTLALNFAVPGTGSVVGRVALLVANLAIDAAFVAISLTQSSLADDPDTASGYRNEAIIGGVLGGVGALIPGVQLGRQGARRALEAYRSVKAASRQAIPELLSKMNWAKLTDSRKITFLTNAVKDSDDALELVRMTGSSDAVEQSIRRGQSETGFVWRNVDSELDRVRSRLKSDVARVRPMPNPPGVQAIEHRRVLTGQQSATLPDEMHPYLSELQAKPSINSRMLRPSENCEAILPEVANFMKEKGLQNIQYRGMFIWANGMDSVPSSHFVVVGSKNGETFVFDLTAARFANKGMPSLDGPLILPEAAWAQRYQNAATTKLMKYKDFDNSSDARITFGPTQRPLPTDLIDGGYVLAEPRWYTAMQTRLGAPSTLLNHAQLEELATERKRYLTQVEALKSRKPVDFSRGKLGYETIEIDGVDKDLSELELTKFFNNPPRSLNAEQRGVMSGLIESARGKRIIQTSISIAAKYREALKLGSTQMIMAPQGFLLTAADATEVGRCMPLVLSLSVALKNKNAKTFFDNLYHAAAQTGASRMIPALDALHGTSIQAHLKPIKFAADREGTVNAIVDTVDGATGTKLFSMDSQSHAMMVGVTVDAQAVKTFHFYDPNIGLSSYSSANDLKKAMRQTVGTKEMGDQYVAYGSGEPKYRLSEINTGALENVDLQLQGSAAGVKLKVRELSDRPLVRR